MSKRNLLVCFDAFGTLFKPKKSIAQQYGEIARSLGLVGFTDEQLQVTFKKAFRDESKKNPNYGKANGMNAVKWWTNIIHNTFQPLIGNEQQIHNELAPRLIYRFSSEEGYAIVPGAIKLLQQLRSHPPSSINRLIVGVITNSDDRVPSVLTSLGFRVSPFRYGHELVTEPAASEQYDIDFSVMSYDAGFEKPDRRIFQAAESMVKVLPSSRGMDPESWEKVFVGDDFEKDAKGAAEAGWNGIFVAEDQLVPEDVPFLNTSETRDLSQLSKQPGSIVAIDSMASLASWIDSEQSDADLS